MLTVGCPSDHGGQIITGDPTMTVNGKPVARIGDLHSCPQFYAGASPIPHAVTPIVLVSKMEQRPMVNGRMIAFEGDMSGCGAVLLKCGTNAFGIGLLIVGAAALLALPFLFSNRSKSGKSGMPSKKEAAENIENQTKAMADYINRNLTPTPKTNVPEEQKPEKSENCDCN